MNGIRVLGSHLRLDVNATIIVFLDEIIREYNKVKW